MCGLHWEYPSMSVIPLVLSTWCRRRRRHRFLSEVEDNDGFNTKHEDKDKDARWEKVYSDKEEEETEEKKR